MRLRKNRFLSFLRICGLFIAGLVVAVVVALSQIDLESVRGSVVGILRDSTGMDVEIDGAVSWRFSLHPHVELNKVRVANADWAKHKDAFVAEKIDVRLSPVSLLRGRPTIQNVKIYDAQINIEKNLDGKYSVKLDKGTVDEKAKTEKPDLYPFKDPGLGGIEFKNLKVFYVDETYALPGVSIRRTPSDDGREYAGWVRTASDVFPFIVMMNEYNEERKIYPVRVALSVGKDALIANVALEGTSKLPIDFIIKGDIDNVAELGDVFNLDLSNVPSVKLNVAGGLDRNKITLRQSSVYVNGTNFTVSGVYDWGKKVPVIKLNVASPRVELARLFPGLYGRKRVRPDRKLNVFKNVPLYGNLLRDKNMTLNVDFDNFIVFRDFNLKDFIVDAKLENNHARIDGHMNIGDGDIDVAADVDIDADGRLVGRVAGIGERIYVGEILRQINKPQFISELPVNVEMYVQADGRNLSEIMQTITGPVYIYSVAAGYAHSALVTYMYGADFLTSLRHSVQDLFSSEKKHNQIKISGVALNAKLRDGVFETQNGFAIETNAINIRLAGMLDLGDEEMRLSLTTVPVRGLKLSLTGNVVNSIELTGSLAEPNIKISGAAVAGKVASATGLGLLLAPFTGGVGLVAGAGIGLVAGDLLENWLADDRPCETAMKRGAPDFEGDPDWLSMPMADLVGGILKAGGDK